MQTINNILISGAETVLSTWEVVTTFLAWLFAAVDVLVNPLLSPVLAMVNPICTVMGDAVYAVLSPLPAWMGLTILSAATGVVMLLAFRYLSNQEAIGRAKDGIKANLLALKLYKEDMRVTVVSQLRLLGHILRLQRYMLTPVLWMTPPMLLGLAQMGIRHQWRPIQTGEQTLIRMNFEAGDDDVLDATLGAHPGITVEAGPVAGGGSLVWRLRAKAPGRHVLRFKVNGTVVEKELVVSDAFERVSAIRPGRSWTTQLLHPAESPLPAEARLRSVEILYPNVDSWIHGADWWVVFFFVVSMVAALILKPVFNVKF